MMTIDERIANYAKSFSVKGKSPLYSLNDRMYGDVSDEDDFQFELRGDFIAGALYKRKNNWYGSYPHSVIERMYALFPDCMGSIFHMFSGSIPYHFPDQITMDIKPSIDYGDIGSTEINHSVKPFINDDVRNIKKYQKLLMTRKIIFADPPYNNNHERYGTAPVNKTQLLIDLEDCCKEGTFLCWLDSSVPIYNARTWHGYGRLTVYVGANCMIRCWSILQRTNYSFPKDETRNELTKVNIE